MSKEETLKAIERERRKIITNKYPLMSEELKLRTLNIFIQAEERIINGTGLMVLLNDSNFYGGNCEVIAQHLGKIIKSINAFECETGDRLNYKYEIVKGGSK